MYEAEAQNVAEYRQRLKELRSCLNVEGVRHEIDAVEKVMSEHGFWDDMEAAQKVVKKLKALKSVVGAPDELHRELEDAAVLIEMAAEEEDVTLADEITAQMELAKKDLDRLELNSLFMDPRDTRTAIVNFHPGAGGTESCD